MSDTPINHRAEAERDYQCPVTAENEAVVLAVDQLRHATLHLADQQARTADSAEVANLIAWKQLHTPRAVDERGLFNDLPVIRDDLTVRIETEMGLGL